jgi:hypothetical protein
MTQETEPTLHFPYGFDEQIAWEADLRGVYFYAVVQLPGGDRVRVGFYDPVRLSQDLASSHEQGESYVTLPGLIVIPAVTREYMEKAVRQLYKEDFFDYLARLPQEE